jgi:hypothetical protein
LGDCDRQQIGGHGNRRAVKIPARDDRLVIGEHHGVVRGGVRFDLGRPMDEPHGVAGGAVHLRRAPLRIGVLVERQGIAVEEDHFQCILARRGAVP